MFNRLQTEQALKNPGITQERLGQYQTPMSPNRQVRPDDAQAEEARRAQMIQSMMGEQAVAMGDPKQTPSIMAKTMLENAQLKKMLAAMQQRQQPMQVPQAAGLESLPAPAVEKGYAGGGIVAFESGGEVERYQSQGFVMPPRYKRTEFFDLFGRNERLGGAVTFDEEKLKEDEQELARIKSGLESGSITNPAALGKLAALERDVQAGRSYLAQRNAPQAQTAPAAGQRAPSVGDTASLGLDRGVPAAARQRQQQQQQSQGAGLASVAPPVAGEPTATGIDFLPLENNASASAGLRGELERIAEQQKVVAPSAQAAATPPLTDKDRLAQRVKDIRSVMEAQGVKGEAGDALREQIKEMQAAQEKTQGQAGLLGLAQTLAAFGAAPRKRALGAAAQTGSQFMTSQEEARRKFAMEMAALKTNAAIADRAEKRGDVATAMKAEQEANEIRARMELLDKEIRSRESEGAKERTFKERQGDLNRAVEEKLTNAKLKVSVDIAKMDNETKRWVASRPPETLRVIEGIAQGAGIPFNEALDKFLTKGADNTSQLLKVWNDMSRQEKEKFGNNQAVFLATFGSGSMKAPSDVTVTERKP